MGQWYGYGEKTELDGMLKVDAAALNKWGYFAGFRSGSLSWTHTGSGQKSSISISVDTMSNYPHARLWYTVTDSWSGEKRDKDYKVELDTTPCYFGGKRWWFICPLVVNGSSCGRRARTLYKGGDYFGCRVCQRLCYSAQNENHRYGMYSFFKMMDYERKADELMQTIKFKYYDGRPTRKYRRYKNLRIKAAQNIMSADEIERLLHPKNGL